MRIFVILTLAGFLLIFYLTGSRETLTALRSFRFSYFLLAALLIAVDFLCGAGRIYIFIRKMGHLPDSKAFRSSFDANLANIFLAAATPFQTGGGIAQIYMLNRDGISIAAATSVSVMNFIVTLAMLLVGGLLSMRWLNRTFENLQFRYLLSFSTFIFYAVIIFFIFFLIRPGLFGRVLERLLDWLGTRFRKHSDTFNKYSSKIHGFVTAYQSNIRYFWKNEKWVLFHNLWMTVVLYFNKCLIAYVVMKGMGLDPGFWEVIYIQLLLIFVLYFCPTPGASFLAETSSAALNSVLIPGHLVSVFSVLWRFFTTYFGVIVGGIVLMKAIGSHPEKKKSKPAVKS